MDDLNNWDHPAPAEQKSNKRIECKQMEAPKAADKLLRWLVFTLVPTVCNM